MSKLFIFLSVSDLTKYIHTSKSNKNTLLLFGIKECLIITVLIAYQNLIKCNHPFANGGNKIVY